jgi:hypothetical protein
MTANQCRAALAKLALTQVGAARLLGVNENTSRNWAREGVNGTASCSGSSWSGRSKEGGGGDKSRHHLTADACPPPGGVVNLGARQQANRDMRLADQMRRFVEGADRGQTTLLPECLGDWVKPISM